MKLGGCFLRLWLQAAVDNAKFGLLGQFNYSREQIYSNLFKVSGKIIYQTKEQGGPRKVREATNIDLSEEWQAAELGKIMKFMDLHIDANRIRNGRTYDIGNFKFSDTLKLSNKYYSYILDRKNFAWDNYELNVSFKNNELTAIESIAIAPALAMAQMHKKYANMLDGFDTSPYIINKLLHKNSHIATMKLLNVDKDDYLLKAISEDGKTVDDLDYSLKELEKGREYAEEMGRKFKELRGTFEEVGASLDYNEDYLKWKEDYHKRFKELSNVAKVAATYKFLEGYKDIDGEYIDQLGIYIPAVSDKKNQINMLSPDIMKNYFKTYNKQVRDLRNAQSNENFKIPAYTGLDLIAKGLCK